MLKACSRCGKIHEASFVCMPRNKPNRTEKERSEERRLRNLSVWHKKSEHIRERSYHLCALCMALGDYRAKDIEVHHIVPLAEWSEGLLEDSNLICLCIAHHKKADRGEISVDKLKILAEKRDAGLLTKRTDTPGG